MKVITYEATVEDGRVKLPESVRLPEHATVYVVVPGVEELPRSHVGSPRPARPEHASDFAKEVVEEPTSMGLTGRGTIVGMESTMRTTSPSSEPAAPTLAPPERVHIVSTPETCCGKPRIAGSRIQVKHLAIMHERQGMSPGEIVAEFPHITLADVYAALAYYHDHREAINAEIAADRAWYEEQKAGQTSRLDERLKARTSDAQDDPHPPPAPHSDRFDARRRA